MAEPTFASIMAEINTVKQELAKPRHDIDPRLVNGAPSVRRGENVMSSRPFSLIKAVGLINGKVDPEQAKHEAEMLGHFRKAYTETDGRNYNLAADTAIIPSDAHLMSDELNATDAAQVMRAAMSSRGAPDPDEMAWIRSRAYSGVQRAALTPSHSWLDESLGGALVKPPEYMGLIELKRNIAALDRAGATTVPLPPQGKAVYSRQTSATTAYWGSENIQVTATTLGTGQVMLEAKKLFAAAIVPNDLFKFAGASADQLLMGDLAKSIALKSDAAGFYGSGGGQPKGIKLYTGTNELVDYAAQTDPTPAGLDTDGNDLLPEDGENMLGIIEDRNFDPDSEGWKWVMRGSRYRSLSAIRSDAIVPGDNSGPFVDLLRKLGDGAGSSWSGFPVVRSAQITGAGTKGAGTGLTEVWGGCWPHLLFGVYGAIEFARSPGENAFLADQTIVRVIVYTDIVPRYPGAFCYYKELKKRAS